MITLTIAIPRYSGRIYVLLGLGLDVQETMRNIDTENVPIMIILGIVTPIIYHL
jgi:hypothetical protein